MSTKIKILNTSIDCIDYTGALIFIKNWAQLEQSCYICVANVHMVMEAYDDSQFCQIVNEADMVTPDGMPLVWVMRLLGEKNQTRVYGPTLTLHVARAAAEHGLALGLYGGTPAANQGLANQLRELYPQLRIVYQYSPPFRPLTQEEDEQVVQEINASGARILLVGLGCPKQERWMAAHKGRISAVMLGVGAAFDIHSGQKPQAPAWMQKMGLEWLFRLITDPKRLWRRYVFHNPRFLVLVSKQLIAQKYKNKFT
jgi:N-acetylglucosaminyldiphosphoundecaprenol N-acetyl-beta-D-mannosaminyltransferase